MTREEAYQILTSLIKSQNLIRHHFSTEAAMKAIGTILQQRKDQTINIEDWALTGLLHDADYEITHDTPAQHTLILEQKIGNQVSPQIMHAIKCHNYVNNKIAPESLMDWAMYTCDELTGFIIACALVLPDKKLASVTPDFVLRKMNEASFAKAVDRKQIKMCEEKLNISLYEYVDIILRSMQAISANLGL